MPWKDECILVYDSGADDLDRMLIFSNAELQRIARSAKIVHVDGTSRVCPRPFYQLFTIHCWHASRCIPVFYALIPGASSNNYGKLTEFLSPKVRNFQVFVIYMELAI